MSDTITVNLIGLLGPDLCSIILFRLLLPVKNKRLFWGMMVSGIIVSRLMRTFVDVALGLSFIPILIITIIITCDGPFFRKLLVAALGIMCMTAAELPIGLLLLSLTGEQLISDQAAVAHLPTYILTQVAYCALALQLSFALRPLARHFLGQRGFTRTSRIVATFPLIQAILFISCVRYMTFSASWNTPVLILGSLVSALAVLSTALLMLDVQASIDKAVADLETEETMVLVNSYMERYTALEQFIETCAMLRHDIRNQLGVIVELAYKGEIEQSTAMIKCLRERAISTASIDETVLKEEPEPDSLVTTTKGNGGQDGPSLVTRRSYRSARAFYLVSFALVALITLVPLHMSNPPAAIWVIAHLAVAVGAVLVPTVFRMLGDAHDADIASERVRSAELILKASCAYGARLEEEAREAEKIRRCLLESIDEVERFVERGDRQGLATHIEATRTASATARRWCEHSAVNMLLEIKSLKAEAAKVYLHADVAIPRDVALPSLDLCAVFSNMLDNAIDAASKEPEDGRWVSVAAGQRAGYMVIRTENGFSKHTEAKRRSVKTFDIEGHGWGLRILSELAHRHNGELTTSFEDGVYVTQVALHVDNPNGTDG